MAILDRQQLEDTKDMAILDQQQLEDTHRHGHFGSTTTKRHKKIWPFLDQQLEDTHRHGHFESTTTRRHKKTLPCCINNN